VGMMTMQAVALRQQSAAHQIPGAHLWGLQQLLSQSAVKSFLRAQSKDSDCFHRPPQNPAPLLCPFKVGTMAHCYNHRYLEGRDQEDCGLRPACTKC
jgi:hypothetical protein